MRGYWVAISLVLGTGCDDAENVTATPTGATGDSMHIEVDIDPSPARTWLVVELDAVKCAGAATDPQPAVQHGKLLEGPQPERVMVVNGFYVAWSPCNQSNVATAQQSYSLLVSRQNATGGLDMLPSEPFTVRALDPCECDPQLVLFNVAMGNEAAVVDLNHAQLGMLPTPLVPRRRQLGSGLHRFELSAPFADVIRSEWELP